MLAVTERHEEVGAALGEAAGAGKAHAAAAADWRAAALKLRHAYDQRQRVAAVDPPRHKKLKALDKELEKVIHLYVNKHIYFRLVRSNVTTIIVRNNNTQYPLRK